MIRLEDMFIIGFKLSGVENVCKVSIRSRNATTDTDDYYRIRREYIIQLLCAFAHILLSYSAVPIVTQYVC
jgi:hypothetical protein